ncbi:lactococcin 972 family bacteriocin [Staphylococcus sp. 17KM0847]|uniref:lactococcin 972 family bacteriocin n=1 Tax=Staphylococcus sp. 17KM0847 TaxID=2583989 RepID=UPI0015DD08CC|nr:lactococcin 972 family bacteriocin [Staphylococcus sp. 17KM0847]QLK86391.1 hypothetical protein FGL66_06650 [Staphylococcus sp. 17KM0847]
MKKHYILVPTLTLSILGIGITGVANANVSMINDHLENVDNYNGLIQSETNDDSSDIEVRSVKSGKKAGGFWIRGIRQQEVISKYKHYKKFGKGTAINGNGDVGTPGWKKPGIFSNGKVKKTRTGNQTYYDYK